MSSHDDPEERIRELERSLNDRSAELTQSSAEGGPSHYGSGYVNAASAPPPPYLAPPTSYGVPPSYGVPFPTVPMKTGGGGGRGWIVIVVMAAITVGIVASGIAFAVNMFSSVTSLIDIPSSSPTVSGGGGPFGAPPTRTAGNRPQITIATPTASSATPGGDISVSGAGQNKTIECNDGVVSISGVSNTVVLTGHCTSVTISGVENVVTIDAADTIGASGFDNRVTYHDGSPEIQKSGSGNIVEQG